MDWTLRRYGCRRFSFCVGRVHSIRPRHVQDPSDQQDSASKSKSGHCGLGRSCACCLVCSTPHRWGAIKDFTRRLEEMGHTLAALWSAPRWGSRVGLAIWHRAVVRGFAESGCRGPFPVLVDHGLSRHHRSEHSHPYQGFSSRDKGASTSGCWLCRR